MSRSLGALTLDLIAKTGGFEQGFDKAQRVADKKLRQIEREAQARSKAIQDAFSSMAGAIAGPLAAAFSVDAIVGYTRQLVQTGVEITRLSQVAGASAGEFQAFAHGASSAGVPMEKFADILKDVQDKIGDFMQTGGGPLKDFFEQIAPKVGVTAESFRNLSGPQALQLFYSSLEKANVSQKEMVFWLEAIASDATRLQPLLKNNAAGFKQSADEAERLGLVIQDDVLQASADLSKNWDTLSKNVQGAFVPALGALIGQLNSVTESILNAKRAGMGFGSALKATIFDGLDDPNRLKKLREWKAEEAKLTQELQGRTAASFGGESQTAAMKARIAELQSFQRYAGLQMAGGPGDPAGLLGINAIPTGETAFTPTPKPTTPKAGRAPAADSYSPLADAAKAYEAALLSLDRVQVQAQTSGLDLNSAQTELLRVMTSPEWLQMPETWRVAIAEQGEYAIAAEQAAASQDRLNALLAATPTAQLEAQRQTMQLLADAFEKGRISAEQFSEAANAALGNTGTPVDGLKDGFLDLGVVANDAARGMADAFADFAMSGKASFGDFAEQFLSQIAKMIAQALALRAIQAAMGFFGISAGGASAAPAVASASGNVFDGGLKAFASGGVVSSPTFFKFASGGGFRNGLMGEAGPEAIMPLKRDSSGKLGVVASGGGSNVVVNVHNNASGAQANVQQSRDGGGNITLDIIVEQIEGKMSQNIARGRSPIGQTIEGLYGLNRARGAVR